MSGDQLIDYMFQHAAARRRLGHCRHKAALRAIVSTRSRPKAAGSKGIIMVDAQNVSTRSRPKAAGALVNLNAWEL